MNPSEELYAGALYTEVIETEATEADAELDLEVALVASVDRAVIAYRRKLDGRDNFTNFEALVPANAQEAA